MDEFSFGAWLQRRRRGLDMTQAELGRRAGIAAATVRKIESDERRPSVQVAERLAGALDIPPAEWAGFVMAARRGSGAREPVPPAARAHAPLPAANGLLAPPTPLVGRAELVAAVAELVQRPGVRLVTLCGPGGVGKTRVALAVADDLRGGAAEVVVAPLAPLTDPALLEAALGAAVGLRDRGDRPVLDQLRDALHGRRLLLVLDNAEHLLAAAPRLAALLAVAPELRMLVTSRAVLNLAGEHVVVVPPLALPDASSEGDAPAVRLLLDRAGAAGATLAADDVGVAAAICRQLDGLPLAIELAAARCRLLSLRALHGLLREGPFEALGAGPRDLPARQQTLRATLDWSVALLAPTERELLAGLGLFPGGCTLPLARAALGTNVATLDGLAALADHSLLRGGDGASGERRFWMLEVVRRYALERLSATGREPALRWRWAQALLALAEECARGLRGPGQRACLDRLEDERPNLRALLAWSLGQDGDRVEATPGDSGAAEVGAGPESDADGRSAIGVRLVAALLPFWWRRGEAGEARRWIDAALAATCIDLDARALLLAQAGRLAWRQGEHSLALARSIAVLEQSRSSGSQSAALVALVTLGTVRWYQGDSATAAALLSEGLALAKAADDVAAQAEGCLALALVAYHRGDHEARALLLARSLELSRAAGDSLGVAEALLWAGNLAVEQGALDAAEPHYREALERFLALDDRDGEARVLHKLADLAHDRGALAEARRLFDACLALRRAAADQAGTAEALIGLGDVLLKQGDVGGAAAHFEAALELVQARGDLVNRAWAVRGLARVARARADRLHARELFAESLRLARAQANPWGVAVCLDGLGGAIAALGDLAGGAALFGAADRVRRDNRLLNAPGVLPDVDEDRAAARASLGEAAFAAAVQRGLAAPLDELVAALDRG